MAESSFWGQAAERFRRLQPPGPERGEPQRASHNGLCAWWKPEGWFSGKPYKFFNDGHDLEANRNIERLFRVAAESAEVEMGHVAGETAVFAWLDRLRLFGLYVEPFVDGTQIMHRVCDASAEYCVKCEGEAKAAAREAVAKAATAASYREVHTKFSQGERQCPDLFAQWEAQDQRWTLAGASQECEQAFEAATRLVVPLLSKSNDFDPTKASSLRDPLDVWLDLMRENRRGFRSATKPPNWRQVTALMENDQPLSSLIGVSASGIEHLFEESSRFVAILAMREGVTLEVEKPAAEVAATLSLGVAIDQPASTTDWSPKDYKSRLGRNIDRLRKECGWSYDDLAKATDLDKKLILGHVNEGKGAYPKTLETYARTFTEKMGKPITVAELES